MVPKMVSALRHVRRFATENSGKLVLNFAAPHQAIIANKIVSQVNLSTTEGDMGILAGHVPTIFQLVPSVLSVISAESTEKYFISGGFAVINPDSSLNVNAVEAFNLKDLDFEAAKKAAADAKKRSNEGSEEERTVALIEAEVFDAVVAAQKA